jgi:hypothetical protein
MKKATITITYDEERLTALRLFLTQKDLDLDRELDDYLGKLFARYVPLNVRDYLELKDCIVSEKPVRKPATSVSATSQGGA